MEAPSSNDNMMMAQDDDDNGDDYELVQHQHHGEDPQEDDDVHEEQADDAAEGSGISGKGMWDAWTRSFDTPLLAFLDLLDNAVDASWTLLDPSSTSIKPKIQIDVDDQIGSGGILMRNAGKSIPPLSQVLQVYKSKKGEAQDAIGENGIGVKHACASLSDLSLVFCKRDHEWLSVGILMKDLQQEKQIVLPSFEWHIQVDIEPKLKHMCTVTHPHTWGRALEQYGDGDLDDGINQCFRHMMAIREGDWRNYPNVFTMVLTELKHEGFSNETDAHQEPRMPGRESKSAEEKSIELLKELQEKMPYLYLHMNTLDIRIMKKPVETTYWERRLIELTQFDLEIPTKEHWAKMHESLYRNDRVTNIRNPKNAVRFFCGFDPFRVNEEEDEEADVKAITDLATTQGRNVNSSTLKLYLYSRQSGRLIKVEHDPRSTLGLSSGSTDFNQGLTIILDDYNGTIPLNPTKQDTSYGVSSHGQIHSDNVREWTAAITHFFWFYHYENTAGKSKKALSKAVASRRSEVEQLLKIRNPQLENPFSCGTFIKYADLHFGLRSSKASSTIRANKPERARCYATYAGDDDLSQCPLIRLDEDAASLLLQEEAKKKAERTASSKRRRVEDTLVNNAMMMGNNDSPVAAMRRIQHGMAAHAHHHANHGFIQDAAAMTVNAQLRQLIENLTKQKQILEHTVQDQANDLATMAQQHDDQKFRADKLEQDMGFLQQQNNHLLQQAGGAGDSTEEGALKNKLAEYEKEVKTLREENQLLKTTASASGGGGTVNESEIVAKLKRELASMKQKAMYYKDEKESAKRQIELLTQEKQRMEARVQQLEENEFNTPF
jgi:hypothetical protein